MLVPLAHAGHWLPYVVPALVVLVAVIVTTIRERRNQDEEGAEGEDAGAVSYTHLTLPTILLV